MMISQEKTDRHHQQRLIDKKMLLTRDDEVGLKHFMNPKSFMEHDMNDIYDSIEE